MIPLPPLTQADCPLMPEGVVSDYNTLAEILHLLDANVPRLKEPVEKMAQTLARVRARVTRDRFQIGFLGPTQASKSTTFNNILGVIDDKERRPSHEGGGSSTTSVITRLRSMPVADPKDEIWLHYATEERYRQKRDKMCEVVHIDPQSPDEEILSTLLPAAEERINRGELKVSVENPKYLRKLLLSRRDYAAQLGRPPVRGEYNQRNKYLTHDTASDAGSPYLLLDDALITFRTDRIHEKLEMIDLPGLGAHVKIDTLMSAERLEELDAAFVFVNVMKRDDADVEEVFDGLRANFKGDLAQRVWLVLTRCDTLGDSFLDGKDGKPENGFDGIVSLANRHRIPMSQVLMISNWISRKAERDADGRIKRASALTILGFPTTPGPLPGLDRNPALVPVYEGLFENGGIDRVRKLLAEDLVVAVRKRARDWATTHLKEVRDALTKEVEFSKRRSNTDSLPEVNACLTVVHARLVELEDRTNFFDGPARQVGKHMHDNFRLRFAEGRFNDELPLADVKERFPGDARSLDIELQMQFQTIIPSIYDSIGGPFGELPEVPVNGQASVQKAWRAMGIEQDVCAEVLSASLFPTFEDDGLLDIHEDEAEAFTGAVYRGLLNEKIDVSIRAAMHVLRWRAVKRLHTLTRALNKLTVIDPSERGLAGKIDYDGLVSRLRTLCPST